MTQLLSFYLFLGERYYYITFALCHRKFVSLSVVCNVGAPYSDSLTFGNIFAPSNRVGT